MCYKPRRRYDLRPLNPHASERLAGLKLISHGSEARRPIGRIGRFEEIEDGNGSGGDENQDPADQEVSFPRARESAQALLRPVSGSKACVGHLAPFGALCVK